LTCKIPLSTLSILRRFWIEQATPLFLFLPLYGNRAPLVSRTPSPSSPFLLCTQSRCAD
jgi:hypothetical protein